MMADIERIAVTVRLIDLYHSVVELTSPDERRTVENVVAMIQGEMQDVFKVLLKHVTPALMKDIEWWARERAVTV